VAKNFGEDFNVELSLKHEAVTSSKQNIERTDKFF
jgi:hypothetical protein